MAATQSSQAPMPHPYTIALTGGVAAGKSAVASRFAALGVPVFDADRVAREVVAPGQPALDEIAARFGPSVIDASGALDRPTMRKRVFADPAEREALEAIIHPRVRVTLRAQVEAAQAPMVLLDIPLLAENLDEYRWVDRVVVIDVPREVQMQRLMARDGMTVGGAEAMIAAQATREQRLAIADDVIVNNGPLEALDRAVGALVEHYRKLASHSPDLPSRL